MARIGLTYVATANPAAFFREQTSNDAKQTEQYTDVNDAKDVPAEPEANRGTKSLLPERN